jgi:hypothetical protein
MRMPLIASLIVLGAASPAFAQSSLCNVPEFQTYAGQQVTGRMEVRTGARCSIGMINSNGPTYSSQILARPVYGTVTMNGHQITYTPKPGYVGPDSFVYTRGATSDPRHPSQRRVLMKINVKA